MSNLLIGTLDQMCYAVERGNQHAIGKCDPALRRVAKAPQ